ncbi:MAG: glutaminase A [Myxococcota bacterium]
MAGDTAAGLAREVLDRAVQEARQCEDGAPASYIPELAQAPVEATSAAIELVGGELVVAGDASWHHFTLQSAAKLILLAGLLEERGEERVFSLVGTEPSGSGFASLARLEMDSPTPANPLINAGAIALCGLLEGHLEDRLGWLDRWVERVCGVVLPVNQRVLVSERRTGDRNRAIAYFLRHSNVLRGDVDEVLETYFSLCSLEASVREGARLAAVMAAGGLTPGGARVLSSRTASIVTALMATCGMYDESGRHLVETGLPAKSGVSGVIVAVAPGRGGVAVASPRINHRGGSVRGHIMLRRISAELGWHLALPPRHI